MVRSRPEDTVLTRMLLIFLRKREPALPRVTKEFRSFRWFKIGTSVEVPMQTTNYTLI